MVEANAQSPLLRGAKAGLGYLWDKYTQLMQNPNITGMLDAYDQATKTVPGIGLGDELVRAPMFAAAGIPKALSGLQKIFKWIEAGDNYTKFAKKEKKINDALDAIAKKAGANPLSGQVDTYSALGDLFDRWVASPGNETKTVEDFLKTVDSNFIANDIVRNMKRSNPDAVMGIEIADDVADAVGQDVTKSLQLVDVAPNPEQAAIAAQEATPFAERVSRAGGQQAIDSINASPAAKELYNNLGILDKYYKKRAESLNYRIGTPDVLAPRTGGAELARQLNLDPATIRGGNIPKVPEAQVLVAQASKAPVLQGGQWLKSRLRNIPLQAQKEAASSMGEVGEKVLRWAQGNYKVSDAARMSGISPEEMLSHLNTFYNVASNVKAQNLALAAEKLTRKPWRLSARQIKEIKGLK